jgi:hypothetical protein
MDINQPDAEVEEFIRQAFAENAELLRFEGGHSLAPAAQEAALQQVLLYWRKLRDVAEKVTETEVKLNLPAQTTPKGRKFGIEGVVDIVRENERTVMYDIKSHDVHYVRANTEFYEQQLNVYAYIWQHVRNQLLDETAIIATAYPEAVGEALLNQDEAALAKALETWDPVVAINFDPNRVEATIQDFGCTVDQIEEGAFAPPPVEKLKSRLAGAGVLFATQVCTECDARFSCAAYRSYVQGAERAKGEKHLQQYFNDYGRELEQEVWRTAGLSTTRPLDGLSDFGEDI